MINFILNSHIFLFKPLITSVRQTKRALTRRLLNYRNAWVDHKEKMRGEPQNFYKTSLLFMIYSFKSLFGTESTLKNSPSVGIKKHKKKNQTELKCNEQ